MKFSRCAALTLVVAVAITAPALADAAGSVPRSALPGVKSVEMVDRVLMPDVDVERLMAEDAIRESSGAPVAPRFAAAIPVVLSPESTGTWETLEDGSRLWRLRIASPGALSLNLGLERFELSAGAKFWIHDADGAFVQGPYTATDQNNSGGLWTAVVLGDELVAELYLPAETTGEFLISSVNHGYRFFADDSSTSRVKRGDCNINVVCPEGDPWRDQIRSVALITISGMYKCTAQLVNNTAQNDIPYLLAAQHCIEKPFEAPSVVAYWNYQTATCDQFFGGSLSQNQSGSTWIASSPFGSGSDFTLVELDRIPDNSYNVFYAGWDARDQIPESTTTIHHPDGDQKSISFDYDSPTITSYAGNESPGNGRYFRIADWDAATTEPGSSGGCLFDDATKRCIGTLSGGAAACDNDFPDWFARFFSQWIGDGTSTTRLSDWLDPSSTGQLFVDGKDSSQSEATAVWMIPAAASAPGAGSSNWKSQISVVNTGSIARNVTLYLVAKGEDWPGTLLTGPFAVRPDESLFLEDPLLPENPAAGMVYASVTGSGTVAFSRTYNLAEDGGTFGQGVPGINLTDATMSTEFILPMVHSVPHRYRTNLGFAQTSSRNFNVLVSIYASSGELLAQRDFGISTGWKQFDNIFHVMGIGDVEAEGAWIKVQLTQNQPSFWTTYATVIDNTTDDPTYVLPVAP